MASHETVAIYRNTYKIKKTLPSPAGPPGQPRKHEPDDKTTKSQSMIQSVA